MPTPGPNARVVQMLEATTGGTRRHLTDLSCGLAARGWQLEAWVAVRRDPHFTADVDRLQEAGVKVRLLDMVRRPAPIMDLRACRQARTWLREHPPAILHCHSSKAGAIGRLAAAPLRRHGLRVVYTPHVFAFMMTGMPAVRRLWLGAERYLSRHTDALVAVIEQEGEAARNSVLREPQRVHVIHNGIAPRSDDLLSREEARAALGIAPERLTVGTVGRLTRQKGQHYLLAAIVKLQRRFPELTMVFVGEGEDRGQLAAEAHRLGLNDRVIFAGHHERASRLMSAFDIYCLPSLWEACPYTLLEAMAAGTPVVASDAGGNPDIVVPDDSGEIVPAADADALAAALAKLLDDASLRRRHAEAAQLRVAAQFSVEAMIDEHERLYRSLLEG